MADDTTRIVKATIPQAGASKPVTISVEATPIGVTEERVANLPHDFSELTDSIQAIAQSLYGAVQKVAPKKASIEFGIEIAMESGKLTALLVKGSGKANLKVTLEWS